MTGPTSWISMIGYRDAARGTPTRPGRSTGTPVGAEFRAPDGRPDEERISAVANERAGPQLDPGEEPGDASSRPHRSGPERADAVDQRRSKTGTPWRDGASAADSNDLL